MAIPSGFCEAWFGYTTSGDNEAMYTHLAYEVTDPIDQASVDAGFTDYITNFKTRVAAQVTLFGGHIIESTGSGLIRWDASVTPAVGTGAGSSLPNNCATLVKKSTASGGRRNRGRMYFPCPLEGEVDGAGVVAGAAVTAWNTAAARLLNGGSVHTAFGFVGLVVLLHDTGSQTPTVITDLGCQTKIATQRRRMRR